MLSITPPNNNMIRGISQTVQERTLTKLAPDIVVYLDGLPYLINYFIADQKTNQTYTLVNFNDHVTAFNAGYDVDIMVPSATIGLQVPNYRKHLYQMPGGNNLIETMKEVQVFSKGYYLANNGDTVYRRVFKGLVSNIGYNDNGKTLEISIQCYGTLHFLELMQLNISPSVQTSGASGVALTMFASIFAAKNPYQILSAMFTYGLNTAGFQQTNLGAATPASKSDIYNKAVQSGYISKWQVILQNLAKDVHIYGAPPLTNPPTTKPPETAGKKDYNLQPSTQTYLPTQTEDAQQAELFYKQIRVYQPEMTISDISLLNNKIISRMEYIRQMVQAINFEAYQDIDGKIVIKPPLYNLDVTNLGTRNPQSSPTQSNPNSSASNPLTEINATTNPFIVYLDEILTENETEDQSAIRRTRTTLSGNILPSFAFGYDPSLLTVGEYIDIVKLQKFGLREEPTFQVPWIPAGSLSLFARAVEETVRANRGYRTYTFTIPIRPELKIGFPIYIPHKDMYGYIKSVNIVYQVGGNATMTVVCDSIRRRVLIPSVPTNPDGSTKPTNQSAPNLIFQWGNATTGSSSALSSTQPNAIQPPGNNLQYFQSFTSQSAQGNGTSSANNPANIVGQPGTLPATQSLQPSTDDNKLQVVRSKRMGSSWTMQPDTATSSYIIANDTANLFTNSRSTDNSYFRDVQHGNIPYTDGKGYEVLAPWPWGRFQDLRSAIKQFTVDGNVVQPTDVNGNPTQNQQDISVLNTTESFLFAGLGTPTATDHPSSELINALAQLQNQADTDTVIVLDYSSGQTSNDNQLLNTAQPDISNQLTTSLTQNTQNAGQQVIDVLVTGSIAPTLNTRQALAEATSPSPFLVGAGNNPYGSSVIFPPAIPPSSAPVNTNTGIAPIEEEPPVLTRED